MIEDLPADTIDMEDAYINGDKHINSYKVKDPDGANHLHIDKFEVSFNITHS